MWKFTLPDEPVLPILAVVEREPSPVQTLNETVIVVPIPPAGNHISNSTALSTNPNNETATTAIVENGTIGDPSGSALPELAERSIYKRITRRIARLRSNRVGDSAGLVEQTDQIKPELAVDDDQNRGRLYYFWKKMAIF
uniref:Uncharacterized protein n=1 Tax=Ditylenchus dipsaci TaxID=166011 RepID=A0A915DML1_9BILA